jgi:hypothetical protein
MQGARFRHASQPDENESSQNNLAMKPQSQQQQQDNKDVNNSNKKEGASSQHQPSLRVGKYDGENEINELLVKRLGLSGK